MSEDTPTQPVVDNTNAQPQAGAEVTDARNDGDALDALLKSYDQQTQPPAPATSQPEPRPGTSPDLHAVAGKLQALESRAIEADNQQFKRDMSDTVKAIRGDLDPGILDDVMVESWLDAQARKDPRLAKAWVDRHANPAQFERVKAELGKNLAKKFSKMPDRQATDDREAVSAAVRGASTRTPEDKPLNVSGLSNNAAADEIEKKYGYRPAF